MSLNHGAIWWSELMTRDVAGALKFYGDICGWTFDETPMQGGAYYVAIAHGKPIAGIMDMTGHTAFDELTPHWFTYIAVDKVDHVTEQLRFAGGTIIRPPFDVPDVGRIAMVRDATGAAVGLMTPSFPTDALVAQDAVEMESDDEEDVGDNFPV